ncbi:MAG: sodium-dependent transporter [Phycisphaerae bacterium]|nr:sodium-dependent transporter [Phycisphaerae bacterium]
MEILEAKRENWGSRGGFILAAIGSAVGLGNLWGFPYKLYSYGGGAFLIPYIVAMFCVGIPMLVLEFSLGHFTQRAAPDAFARTHRRLEFVGWWGILLGFVIVTYYPIILAYCLSFMYYSAQSILHGTPLPWSGEGVEGVENAKQFFFTHYLTEGTAVGLGPLQIGPWELTIGPFQANIIVPLVIAWVAMYLCICKGVNTVGKIVWLTVPLPWLILAILTIRGITLPGSVKGLVYYLDPDWSQLVKPTTWRYAFGQVFFSLSLAFGVMLTYASFLHRRSDLNNNAAIIGLADFATSFIAGFAIFSTLGAMAYATGEAGAPVAIDQVVDGGPGLAFVAFPYALAQLPASAWWSLLFFFTLVTLGIDSAFSITESVLAGIVDKTGWPRWLVLPLMSLVGLVFGLIYVKRNGLNWLGTIDGFINGTWGIAFLGLLECAALGWLYNIEILRAHANERSDWNLGKWWSYAIRIVIPVILGTLFLWSLFDDLSSPGGFLKNPTTHEWNVYNVVGLAVVATVPIISVLMSLLRNPKRPDEEMDYIPVMNPLLCRGRLGGLVGLLLAIVSAGLIISLTCLDGLGDRFGGYLLYQSLGLSVAALVISNFLIERYTEYPNHPSWFVRWAGIVATLDISAFLAVTLVRVTSRAQLAEPKPVAESLGTVPYIILAVVFLLIIVGLGWCFYRAVTAAGGRDTALESDIENI